MTIPAGLAALVGAAHVVTDPHMVAPYNDDGRTGGGQAMCVVRPGDAAEVSAMVRWAAAAGVRLIPQGRRSGLVGAGLSGGDRDVIVSLERLAAAPVIDRANRTARVEAGVALSTLNAVAAKHGLTFPIDLGADPAIGGMIASNTGGARLMRYGDVRRNVLSLDMVRSDADGTALTLGRPVWKDSGGLDLKQMAIGASGSTGFVTAATLALHPLPATRVTAMIALHSIDPAIGLLLAAEDAFGALLTAFEGISSTALQAALAHAPRLVDPFADNCPGYVVLMELSAGAMFTADELEERLGRLLMPMIGGAIRDVAIDRGNRLWAIRHAVPDGLRAAGRVVACDIAVPRGAVPDFRRLAIERIAAISDTLVLHDFGHIGDGGVHANMVWPHGRPPFDPAAADAARAVVLATAARDFGGSFSAEHGVGPANIAAYAHFIPPGQRMLAGGVQRLMAPVTMGRVDFTGELR